jgi:hypothetical protein
LLEQARKVQMSGSEKAEQRISFAFGSANIENANVTKEMVSKAAKQASNKKEHV